jgi:murein L,D-transpeptidase YafK
MIRARTLLMFLVMPVAGCAVTSGEFAAIDSCLQAGQAWNYRISRCERSAAGQVDLIRVDKSERMMSVYRDGRLVREFRVALGRGGPEPKQQQGDGRVPEGRYRISAHNPNSSYHLSLRIDYPTAEQIAAARRLGVNPGGDIMIHGLPNDRGWVGSRHTTIDWTDGCIAVTNPEIEWLYKAVAVGTPVEIHA